MQKYIQLDGDGRVWAAALVWRLWDRAAIIGEVQSHWCKEGVHGGCTSNAGGRPDSPSVICGAGSGSVKCDEACVQVECCGEGGVATAEGLYIQEKGLLVVR